MKDSRMVSTPDSKFTDPEPGKAWIAPTERSLNNTAADRTAFLGTFARDTRSALLDQTLTGDPQIAALRETAGVTELLRKSKASLNDNALVVVKEETENLR